MNILIPMAGLGSRFPSDKFPLPKPLIRINHIPMIVKAVNSLGIQGQFLYVISKNRFTEELREWLLRYTPDCKIIEIDYLTEGPACSALLFENEIDNDDELIIANCDQIMTWNSEQFLANVRMFDGAVVTYYHNHERNSYAKVNRHGLVTQIKEKQVISNIALNGIHYWKQGSMFVNSAKQMIKNEDRADNGEFYVGPTYNYLISKGKRVGIHHIPNEQHHAVGIPEDLEAYIRYEDSQTE